MTTNMLVRAAGGAWETLTEQTTVPTGGVPHIFGEDLAPLVGSPTPLLVVATSPPLATGAPDAVCVTPGGDLCIAMLALDQPSAERAMAELLAHAGALQGLSAIAFAQLCNRVSDHEGGLAGFVGARAPSVEFHRKSFEVTIADNLANGRFHLTAFVASAPESLIQSMRFLNSSGTAQLSCFEIATFAGTDISAIRVNPVDVGAMRQAPKDSAPHASASLLVAVAERTQGEVVGAMMAQLQTSCTPVFDEVIYDGDNSFCSMNGVLSVDGRPMTVLVATSDGTVDLRFDAIATVDRSGTARAELVHGLSRLLGADLGDARKVKNMTLNIAEHLNDATLVECLAEVLSDALQVLRPEPVAA